MFRANYLFSKIPLSKINRKTFYLPAVIALLLSSVSVNAAAENQNQSFVEMTLGELMSMEVFRSASLLPTKKNKAPGTVYSFTREDFTRLGVRKVEDLLQFVPGIQLNQYKKRHRAIWMRGLLDRNNDKVVLLVDGIRTRHLYYNDFSLEDSLPLNRVEKVEIIQGPASSLYGANAFGGIISVTTRDFAKIPGVETTFDLADNDRGKVSAFYNSPKLQAFGSVLQQKAPFREDRKTFTSDTALQPLDEEYSNLSLKASPLEGLTLMLDYQKNEKPFVFMAPTQDGFIDEQYLRLAALYEMGDIDTGKLEASLYYDRDDILEYEKEQVTQNLGYEEQQNGVMAGLTVIGLKRLFTDHIFAMGFSWQYEEAKEMDYVRNYHFAAGWYVPPRSGQLLSEPGIKNNDYAIFFQDVWDINPQLNLTLGARYDKFNKFDEHFNYRAALVYSPDENQTWKMMYGTAIRTPSFREYLKVMEGTSFVPPIPEPEKISSLELAYHYQWEQSSLEFTLFDNEVKDYIHEDDTPPTIDDPAGGADEYFTNSDNRWAMRGAEILWRYHPTNLLRLRLGISYLEAEEEGVGDLPYLAPWTASLNMNYNYRSDHNIGLSLFYNDNRSDTNFQPEDQAGSFVLANLYTFGNINKNWSYELGVDNLFDKRVYDPAGEFSSWRYNNERNEREVWLRMKWSLSY